MCARSFVIVFLLVALIDYPTVGQFAKTKV